MGLLGYLACICMPFIIWWSFTYYAQNRKPILLGYVDQEQEWTYLIGGCTGCGQTTLIYDDGSSETFGTFNPPYHIGATP